MKFIAELTGEAASLGRQHREMLERLPATLHAFILAELQKWTVLFAPEQRYQHALLDHLSKLRGREWEQATAAIARIEGDAGVTRLTERNPPRFQDAAQSLLRARGLFVAWRSAVDEFFQSVDPALESRLYPQDAPRRLIVQLYGSGITVERSKLWRRFAGAGTRVPLNLDGVGGSEQFLEGLFGAPERERVESSVLASAATPFDSWVIESNEALHTLCGPAIGDRGSVTGLSYERLRGYRDELTRALNRKVQSGVENPQAFAAYARSLRISPPAGAVFDTGGIVSTFVRDVLLTGNGTLLMNNTFVEWAAVQALRRAQPRMLVARFGVRDRLKPFSSMVMFAQPRAADHIAPVPDPVGSFIDVEQLSYYVWLNAEKNPAYRRKTLYLFLADGIDEMLAIRSDVPLESGRSAEAVALHPARARLTDVRATMAQWLGLPQPKGSGRPIAQLTPT